MAEIEQRPLDPRSDLAGAEVLAARGGPFQLWIGGAQVVTDAAIAAVDFQKYEIAALDTAVGATFGQLVRFVPGTHEATQAVVVAQPVTAGMSTPYFAEGRFNHEALIWPAGTALDTYAERKAFFTGTILKVGHLI